MDKIEIITSLGKIIVFLMILFSIFLFGAKGEKKLANRIFSIFLLVTALDLSGLFLNGFLSEHPNFVIIKTASSLLQMPLFYLYVLSVCYSNFEIKPKHLGHALLFLVFVFILKITSYSEQSLHYYRIAGELQYFIYIIAVFYVLKRYKTVYHENYSNADRTGYKWLFQITIFFCIAHVLVILKEGALFLGSEDNIVQNIYVLISISALLFICWFVLKALHNPQLFKSVRTELVPVGPIVKKGKKKEDKDDLTLMAIDRLSQFMENDKPYLDFELTLEKLASKFDMPEKELSLLINHRLGKHFFDFINEYRINEAKKILKDPEFKNLTVLEILYKVGFNSKSSFYTAFRKITDQTPTAFRKSHGTG